ncbi:MAG TPA: sterol desaturase family protein, partial [Myxococcota bacterium]
MDLVPFAIPFFLLLMGVELVVGWRRGREVFRHHDVLTDLSLGTLQVIFTVVAAVLVSGLYLWLLQFRLFDLDPTSWWVVLFAFVAVDFLYYWFHRASHRSMIFWATHAPHHSSEDYNLAVALRQGPVQPLASQLFYLPLALLGVPFPLFVTMKSINLIYQFWIHTELVDRIGVLERVLNTPSHHRVHHGANGSYIDKNHGGILIIWDRMFGTFVPETTPAVYGTVTPARTWN